MSGLQGTVIRSIFQAAGSMGAAFEKLCEVSGIDKDEIGDSEKMVEWEKAALIWVPLLKLSGDPLIGLHIGAEVKNNLNGMVGFLVQSSRDLNQACEMFCRYGHMVSPMVTYTYTVDDNLCIVENVQHKLWVMKYPEPARHANDFLVAALINMANTLTGRRIIPVKVELAYEKRNVSGYREVLDCDVVFGKETNKIFYRREDMDHPLVSSDQSMFQMFNSIVAERYSALQQNATAENLRQLLFLQFKGRIPTIEEAAAALNMTPRTLQNKLAQENASFRDIAGQARKEIALHLIRNSSVSLSEISDILGYSDLTAFRKAFRSWTNATPGAIRKQTVIP